MANEIKTDTAPSVSIGEMKSMQIDHQRNRQTFADTLATRATQGFGVVFGGAATVGTAVAQTLGLTGAAQLGTRLSAMSNQMAVSGGSGPVSFNSASVMQNTGEVGSASSAMTASNSTAATGSAAALPQGPSALGNNASGQAAFGAGAMALPGTAVDAGAGAGMGMGGAGVGGMGGGMGMGGAMGGAVGAAAGGDGQAQLLNATKQMQETQMSFNLQYLQLQSQMQHENRSYTAVSNIMKTKHDTVKNSISNIR